MASVVCGDVRYIEHAVIAMELKYKLKLIRKHLSLTQDQLAEKLGLSSESRRARVSEWESGKSEPGREILLKYAELGDVEIKNFIDDHENIFLDK